MTPHEGLHHPKQAEQATATSRGLYSPAAGPEATTPGAGGDKGSGGEELTEKQQRRKALLPFVIISLSYLLFTITDGSVRMIVLLHAYNLKFTAMEVAIMFCLYETAGVFTNLLAGVAGAKWGIRFTLLFGLSFQFVGLGMLFGWNPSWSKTEGLIYVTVAQMFSGISKDLTKLGGKTVTKLVTPEEKQGQLFKLVSWITGFKNSLKGVGYFIGAACMSAPIPGELGGYYLALGVNVFLIVAAIPWAAVGLSNDLGTAKSKNATLREALFSGNHNLNYLSLARLFLFASRDLWFEVPLPFYLRAPPCEALGLPCQTTDAGEPYCPWGGSECVEGLCQNLNVGGGCGGLGLDRVLVGTFLALYIIVYGQMQAAVPWMVLTPLRQSPPNKWVEILWGLVNSLPTLVLWLVVLYGPHFISGIFTDKLITMIVGIAVFALIFAVNSSIHSYLVVRYADGNKVAQSVGFYYMSNAVGRLMGTLVSGAIFSGVGWSDYNNSLIGNNVNVGIAWCFFAGTVSSLLAMIITFVIKDNEAGLMCGVMTCVPSKEIEEGKGKGELPGED